MMRVAVLGAGASGLTTAKALAGDGLEPVVFEARASLGGVWNYSATPAPGTSPAYESLRANTSRRLTAFSDHPFDEGTPDFPSRAQMLAYLESYAARFGLAERIRFETPLDGATPRDDGSWRIASGETFGALVVCNGRYRTPLVPTLQGQADFDGEVLHASAYRRPEPFAGRRILVVGIGNSAVEIAAELSKHATVTLSTRSGAWLIPHDYNGKPYDYGIARYGEWVPELIRHRVIRELLGREYARRGLDRHPTLRTLTDLPMPNGPRIITATGLLEAIADDRIAIKPGIQRLGPGHVAFVDGTRADVDTVVFATGYRFDFPALRGVPGIRTSADLGLYRHVFHPRHPNLAFVGMCSVGGPNLPVMEMQARWLSSVLAGKTSLPSPRAMQREVDTRRTGHMKVELIPYLDELAAMIGAMPRFTRRTDMLRPLLLDAFSPAQYRLDGPGSANEADVRRELAAL